MLHLRPSDYRVMPWKDGGGTTTEMAIEPAGSSLSDRFLWRVSSARVEASGPFSRFPGYARALVLLDGAGFILDIEGKKRERLKHPEHPCFFCGDDAVFATLIQGPCLDFGVISDPARVEVDLRILSLGPDATSLALAPTTLLFAPRGRVSVDPLGTQLGPMDTLRMEGPASRDPEKAAKVGLRASDRHTPLVVVAFRPI